MASQAVTLITCVLTGFSIAELYDLLFFRVESFFMFLQIINNINELEQSVNERDATVKKAEDGASHLKLKFEELSKNLNDFETNYQVRKASS